MKKTEKVVIQFLSSVVPLTEMAGFNRDGQRKRIWKNHMEEIMNKEKDWDVTEASMAEEPIKNAT